MPPETAIVASSRENRWQRLSFLRSSRMWRAPGSLLSYQRRRYWPRLSARDSRWPRAARVCAPGTTFVAVYSPFADVTVVTLPMVTVAPPTAPPRAALVMVSVTVAESAGTGVSGKLAVIVAPFAPVTVVCTGSYPLALAFKAKAWLYMLFWPATPVGYSSGSLLTNTSGSLFLTAETSHPVCQSHSADETWIIPTPF